LSSFYATARSSLLLVTLIDLLSDGQANLSLAVLSESLSLSFIVLYGLAVLIGRALTFSQRSQGEKKPLAELAALCRKWSKQLS
jgi:hypothetical protein